MLYLLMQINFKNQAHNIISW